MLHRGTEKFNRTKKLFTSLTYILIDYDYVINNGTRTLVIHY